MNSYLQEFFTALQDLLTESFKLCKWSKGNARRLDWHRESIRPGDIVIMGGAT